MRAKIGLKERTGVVLMLLGGGYCCLWLWAAVAWSGIAEAQTSQGVQFGLPTVFSGPLEVIAVPVTNTTSNVLSFTVEATFQTGTAITGTAEGAVNDLLPGQERVAMLVTGSTVPASYDTLTPQVDTLVENSPTTTSATAAGNITLGSPSVLGGAFPTVALSATNGDSAPHTFSVQTAFLQGGTVVGVAEGAVNDLAAGQTKTATLLLTGTSAGADTVLSAVDTLVQ